MPNMLLPPAGFLVLTLAFASAGLCPAAAPVLVPQSGHSGPVQQIAGTKDNRLLLSTGADGTLRIRDLQSGLLWQTVFAHAGAAHALALDPKGELAATAGEDRFVRMWRVEDGSLLWERHFEGLASLSLAWLPDGSAITVGADSVIVLARDGTERANATPAPLPERNAAARASSADGRRTFAGDFDGNIKVLNTSTGKTEAEFRGDTSQVLDVGFRADGRLEVLRSDGNALLVASPSPDGAVTRLSDSFLAPAAAQRVGTGTIASSSPLRISLFDTAARRAVKGFDDQTVSGWPLACDGQSRCAWQTVRNGANALVLVRGLPAQAERRELPLGSDEVLGLAFTGKFVAAGTNNGTVRIWDSETGAELPPLRMPAPDTPGILFDYNPALSNALRHKLFVPLPGAVSALGSDGQRWLAAGNGRGIEVCDTTAAPLRCYDRTLDSAVAAIALSGDSVLWTDAARKLRRWRFAGAGAPETLGATSELARQMTLRADGRMAAILLQGSAFELWDLDRRALLATVNAAGTGWLAATPDGLFDASEGGWRSAAWRFPGADASPMMPVEVYFQDFYHPNLIADLLRGEDPHPVKSLAQLDRDLPVVNIENKGVTPEQWTMTPAGMERTLSTIDIRVSAAGSHVFDLRVILNGALVRRFDGELRAQELTLPLMPGANEVRAYAFNRSGVKSLDAVLTLPMEGYGYAVASPTLRILAIGIDRYRNSAFDLRFAQADADLLASALDRTPADLHTLLVKLNGLFNEGSLGPGTMSGPRQNESLPGRVQITKLLNEQATRAGILAALDTLAKETKPEDAVLIFYAGHGLARGERYYLLPHDMAARGTPADIADSALDAIAASALSDQDLERALEAINPRFFGVVLDSCQSGKVLEGDRPRGPLNGSGMARLVYEKGIFLLAASQSFQDALEVNTCGHGLLSCALISEGLLQGKADFDAADGRIDLAEWFRYAENRVPELARTAGSARAIQSSGRAEAQRPAFVTRATPATDKLIVALPEKHAP